MKITNKLAVSACIVGLLAACGNSDGTQGAKIAATNGTTSASMGQKMNMGDEMASPTLTVTPAAQPVPGQPVKLTLLLTGSDGTPLGTDAIEISHEHKVHVMIVDSALEDYTHAHAEPGAKAGEWTVTFTPKYPREYRVWTDFNMSAPSKSEHGDHGNHGDDNAPGKDVPDSNPMSPSATVLVGTQAGTPVAAASSLSTNVDGFSFTLGLGGALKAGTHVPATLTVADASGAPVTKLEPIMGAYAHLVGFSADGTSMVHGHPEGEEPKDASARGGPALTFELHPEIAGPVRAFVQVKISGKVITVPFTMVVGS